ncbi:MAG: class I SAM-dependent methyltransferase [Candidatus Heimdallarchaeota archaeon]|nr:class I SAM-dependent methyltransferase [Candidatus Heimdallarchaeota archaeon]MBY8993302.1 class I SAM-dependent methyltransferase [Candidatus Heimdallarchaeota archaeon]
MRKIITYYLKASMGMKRILWRFMHRFIIRRYEGSEVVFLNYGYEYLDSSKKQLQLDEIDEKERYCLQLYHSTVEGIDLKNKDVLEIGCGRGGGASYITRYLKTKSYIGLDMSKDVIKFNSKYHKITGLSFVVGNAQEIKFDDQSFDALVNVESSRSYNDFEAFVSESYRVLRPKGHLLFADIRTEEENEILREQFRKAGFKIIKEENIIRNVVKALDLDSERRAQLMKEKAPKIMHGIAEEFSSTKGSKRYQEFSDGTQIYMQYILQKE